MATSGLRSDLTLAALAGSALGLVAGLTHVAAIAAFFGFWVGLIWPILVGAVGAFWYVARRRRGARPALVFASGVAAGAVPGLWLDVAEEQAGGAFELGFAIALALLVGLLLAPAYLALRARVRRGDA